MAAALLPFQNRVTQAYLNSDVAFTSASTVYSTLRRESRQAVANASETVDYPSRDQVKNVLGQIDIVQTTQPYKVNPAEYDSTLARDRGPGLIGNKRHQVQFDLAIFDKWWRSNRINPGDTKEQSFIYAAVFIDVWSRLVVAYPIANKNAATLRRVVQQAWLHFGGF